MQRKKEPGLIHRMRSLVANSPPPQSVAPGSSNGDFGGGYVKLVKPGGKVVQVRGPVRAGDVMQSTQHYVTLPDVFRASPVEAAILMPEVILMPGHKFYLLPYHTVASLLIKDQAAGNNTGFVKTFAPPTWEVQSVERDNKENLEANGRKCLEQLLKNPSTDMISSQKDERDANTDPSTDITSAKLNDSSVVSSSSSRRSWPKARSPFTKSPVRPFSRVRPLRKKLFKPLPPVPECSPHTTASSSSV